MPPKEKDTSKNTIKTYLTRQQAKGGEKSVSDTLSMLAPVGQADENPVHNANVTGAMTESENVSTGDLRDLLVNLDTKMSVEFGKLNCTIDKLSLNVERVEFELKETQEIQIVQGRDIEQVKEEITDLREQLLRMQVYNRKYNVLIYGLDGQNEPPEEIIEKIRTFGKESLKLDEDFVNKTHIRHAHRLQERPGGPAPIIVKFLNWSEREAFLRAGRELRDTKMSIRTDLPPILKKKRGELASKAYDIRKNRQLQTRIREKGTEVWIEVRKTMSDRWRKL